MGDSASKMEATGEGNRSWNGHPVTLAAFCWLEANYRSHPQSRRGDMPSCEDQEIISDLPVPGLHCLLLKLKVLHVVTLSFLCWQTMQPQKRESVDGVAQTVKDDPESLC